VNPDPAGILILFNQPLAGGTAAFSESDAGVLREVEAVETALRAHGRAVRRAGLRRLRDIPAALDAGRETVVFNLVERLDDSETACNFVPAVCETMGRACTGGSSESLCLTLDKGLTKSRLRDWGVSVAEGAVLPPDAPIDPLRLPPFPLLVKPVSAGGSEGIDAARSIVRNRADLDRAAAWIHRQFGQPALAEPFLEGREFNLSLIERDGRIETLPISEVEFSRFPPERPAIMDYAAKWIPGTLPGCVSPRRVPAQVEPALAARLTGEAERAWRACGCRDYARIDFRADRHNRPYVLDVNVNPDIEPLAGLPASLQAAGIPFDQFVWAVVENARRRGAATAD